MITLDAPHAQRNHARELLEERGTHYPLPVKNNQPILASQFRTLP